MRVYCSCGEKARVRQSERVSNTIRTFYATCDSCGAEWKGTIALDYQTRPPRNNVQFDLLEALSNIPVEKQQEMLEQAKAQAT